MHDARNAVLKIIFRAGSSIIGHRHLELALRTGSEPLLSLFDIRLVLGARLDLAPIDLHEVPLVPELLFKPSAKVV